MDLKWKQFEKDTAKNFKGKRNRGSGNRWYNPGDVKSEKFLFENKQTEKKSFAVSLKLWDKIYEEALFAFRIPILTLQIQNTKLVVLSEEDFKKLLGEEISP